MVCAIRVVARYPGSRRILRQVVQCLERFVLRSCPPKVKIPFRSWQLSQVLNSGDQVQNRACEEPASPPSHWRTRTMSTVIFNEMKLLSSAELQSGRLLFLHENQMCSLCSSWTRTYWGSSVFCARLVNIPTADWHPLQCQFSFNRVTTRNGYRWHSFNPFRRADPFWRNAVVNYVNMKP